MGRVSVIISTYSKRRLGFVLDCLESLRKQSLKPDETILVLDPDPDLVEFYESQLSNHLEIVVSHKCGLSNARNAGVVNTTGEIMVFIDDDAVATEDWLKNLVESYSDPNVVGVGGLIRPLWENGYPTWFPEELNWVVGCSYKGLPESKSYVRNPIGCNMSFRKAVFEKVGYFRSDVGRFGKMLLAGEEPELSLRILKAIPNAKIVYDPAAIVYHRVRKDRARLDYLFRRSFFEGLSKALIINQSTGSEKSFSAENQYLKYLIVEAIPTRLKKAYKPQSLCQLLVLLLSATAVFVGFAVGKSRKQKLRG
jgi:glycosyltransferase involved in cell wall biosynthesis